MEQVRSTACWTVFGVAVILAQVGMPIPAQAEWSAIAEQKTSYTTNAFQFSSARRLAFSEDPSQPTVVSVTNPEDVIWEPSIEIIRSASDSFGRNELSVKAHGYIFTDNAIFDHGDYRIQDRQWLDSDTSILLRYRYVPNLFLGPNFERQTGTKSIQQERVTSHNWRMEIERRLGDQVNVAIIGRYGLRLYNEAFSERDTKFYTVGSRLKYQAASRVATTLSLLYERGLADGRQETQFDDDVSYYLYMISFGTEFQISSRLALNLVYSHLRKTFTSDLVGDLHMGRRDFTNQGLAELSYQLTRAATATLGFQHTQRTSTNTLRDFNDTIVSIGGQYQF